MKNLLFCLFVLMISSFTGCDDENEVVEVEEVIPTELLSVTVASDFNDSDENWIIIHDENGDLLEYKKFQLGDEFVIETVKTVPGSTLGVTILQYDVDGTEKRFSLLSYLNLEIGKAITLEEGEGFTNNTGAVTGNFLFTVEDYPSYDRHVLSDKFSNTCQSSVNNTAEHKLTVSCESVANINKYFFSMTDASGNLKYKVLEGVAPGGSYTSSYDELSSFDQTVDFTFPESNNAILLVRGVEPGQPAEEPGFLLDLHSHYLQSRTTLKAGYLNSFSKHNTFLFLEYPGFGISYTNRGSVPAGNIVWPVETDFAINSEPVNDFSSTASSFFKFRESRWLFESGTPGTSGSWYVRSSSKSQKISGLPAEILKLYPTLKVDEFEYYNTTFFAGTRTYAKFVAEKLEGDEDVSGIDLTIRLD